jgi:L-asparaginase II
MAVDIPTLTALRDALIEARLSGVRVVRDSNGEQLTYATDAEMAAAIKSANDLIAAAQPVQPVNTLRFHTSKGLDRCRTMWLRGGWW